MRGPERDGAATLAVLTAPRQADPFLPPLEQVYGPNILFASTMESVGWDDEKLLLQFVPVRGGQVEDVLLSFPLSVL